MREKAPPEKNPAGKDTPQPLKLVGPGEPQGLSLYATI